MQQIRMNYQRDFFDGNKIKKIKGVGKCLPLNFVIKFGKMHKNFPN